MVRGIRKKVGEKEYVLVWVPAEDTTLGDAHYIDTTDYQIPTPEDVREHLRESEPGDTRTLILQCRVSEYFKLKPSPCENCAVNRNVSCFNNKYKTYTKCPLEKPMATKCPKCGSDRLYKTGFHYLQAGPAQRWLCRTCGYRFSERTIWACKDCGICFPQGKPGNNCPTCGRELTCLTMVKYKPEDGKT